MFLSLHNNSNFFKVIILIGIIFLISALITPPDIISQIGLAVPVICLYEFSIFLSKFFEKKKK